ncbi:hypothetical protein [Altererythrobacter sp. MF3-039]|uniref:hypothetical protein n=1 Tax=Altererythrobacter sp. MF3-039 TaxID=3252901 RepID=UPI00390C5B50
MRTWIAALLAAMATIAGPAAAQDAAVSEITATVDRFFVGLNTNNPDAMAAEMIEQGITTIVIYGDEGERVITRTFKDDIENFRNNTAELNEIYWDPTIVVHRDIAIFWAPYSIDIDGKRSHCGIDSFDMVRVDGVWKISAMAYTVEPKGCPEGR